MQNHRYLFSQLTDEDIDWLAGNGRPRSLSDRESIIVANTNIMAIFIVLQGKLGVVVENHEVTKLQPGEIVGEMSLIDTRPTSATVLSDGPAHVLELDKAALVARLAANTGFAARFYKAVAMALSDRLRGLLARDEPHDDDPTCASGWRVSLMSSLPAS